MIAYGVLPGLALLRHCRGLSEVAGQLGPQMASGPLGICAGATDGTIALLSYRP